MQLKESMEYQVIGKVVEKKISYSSDNNKTFFNHADFSIPVNIPEISTENITDK